MHGTHSLRGTSLLRSRPAVCRRTRDARAATSPHKQTRRPEARRRRPRRGRAVRRPPIPLRSAHRAKAQRPSDTAPAQSPEPAAAGSPGGQGIRTKWDGTHIIAAIINVPASGPQSVSGRNRTAACTSVSAGSQTAASGRNPRGPLRTFLSVSQGLTASHDGSVQAPASRKEPRRERGASPKRGRRGRGSGGIRNRGDRT